MALKTKVPRYGEGDVVLFDHYPFPATNESIKVVGKIFGMHEDGIITVQLMDYAGWDMFADIACIKRVRGVHEFLDTNQFTEIHTSQLLRKFPYHFVLYPDDYTATRIREVFSPKERNHQPIVTRWSHVHNWEQPELHHPPSSASICSGEIMDAAPTHFMIMWHYRDLSDPKDSFMEYLFEDSVLPLLGSYCRNRDCLLAMKAPFIFRCLAMNPVPDIQEELDRYNDSPERELHKESLRDPELAPRLVELMEDIRALGDSDAPGFFVFAYLLNFSQKLIPKFLFEVDFVEDLESDNGKRRRADDEEKADDGDSLSIITDSSGVSGEAEISGADKILERADKEVFESSSEDDSSEDSWSEYSDDEVEEEEEVYY